MLVSVAVVLLKMTLFAQVFQIAGGSISTQRGIMENDQRARTAQILIAGDLNKRTFRRVIPFAFNEDPGAPEADLGRRQGYVYISENVGANDGDDVLALTVDARITTDSPDVLPFYGRAQALWPVSPPATGLGTLPLTSDDPAPPGRVPSSGLPVQYRDDYHFRTNPNQPETDDSRLDYNLSASSPAAEVVYFLRNGNLYRRVLLMRQPVSGDTTQEQPTDAADTPFFTRAYVPPVTSDDTNPAPRQYPNGFATAFNSNSEAIAWPANFWRHFDYSAHPGDVVLVPGSPPEYYYNGLVFNGTSSLLMAYSVPMFPYTGTAPTSFQAPPEIAYPPNRFGFNTINARPLLTGPTPPQGGLPREYGNTGWWVGRPTMEETSHANFDYPMLTHVAPSVPADANNEMNTASTWNDTAGGAADAVMDAYIGGSWRGEELLLTNVHAFDVKVWDETTNRFVNIGDVGEDTDGDLVLDTMPVNEDTNGNGRLDYPDFHPLLRRNTVYGPNGFNSRVFDTWYPFRTEDINGVNGLDVAEDTNGNGIIDGSETDDDGDGIADGAEDGNASTQIEGQLLDFNADGTVTLSDSNGDGLVDFGENMPPYRPVTARSVPGADGSYTAQSNPTRYPRWYPNSSATAATWYEVGDRIFPSIDTGGQAVAGDPFYYICVGIQDPDGFGDPMTSNHDVREPTWQRTAGLKTYDGDLIWQAVDNRKPLRAIQITLRFLDPTTSQMRTLTLQHSLVD